MSIKAEHRTSVQYICTECKKSRIIFIPNNVLSLLKSGSEIFELVDVHICKNKKHLATKLFIDQNNTVRSYIIISSRKKEVPSLIEKKGESLRIPTPSIENYPEISISPTIDFGSVNLQSFKIIDKLREEIFVLSKIKQENLNILEEVNGTSDLNFIETTFYVKPELNKRIVQLWISKINNIIENLPFLDSETFVFLPAYLDRIIVEPPNDFSIVELDLLLQARIAIPHVYKTNIEILEQNFDDIFPMTPVKVYKYLMKIMQMCLQNKTLTIYDIYTQFEKDQTIVSFPYFLSLLSKIASFGFVNIERLEFLTK